MFTALGREIEELDIPLDGAALVEALNLADRLAAKIADAMGAFDAASLWELDSAVSMTSWLRAHAGLTGSFDAEAGAVIAAAVGLATSPDAEGETRSAPERRADAFTDICRHYLDHRGASPQGRRRPHLNVVVDYATLTEGGPGQVVGGGVLDGSEIKALLCDCEVHRVITDGRSVILDYGTATRTVSAALFAALALRDQRCRHPGCDRPVEWCEAHHVIPVLAGGETCLANLVLKCSRHHHIGHKPGWSEKLEPDGTLVITDPRGRTYVSPPPGVLSLADAWSARAA
ncbi:MAG: HNH endonuclease [Actinobacteria bacterium]|nr:HNH endonuclease [Actinomycetota bacterium]